MKNVIYEEDEEQLPGATRAEDDATVITMETWQEDRLHMRTEETHITPSHTREKRQEKTLFTQEKEG